MQVLLKSLKKLRIQDWATSMIFTGLTSHYLVFQQPFFNCKSTLKIIDSKTYQSINVVACSFINEQCDTQFESVYTLYGKCLRFRPKWVVIWYISILLHSIFKWYLAIKKIWLHHLVGKQLWQWLFPTMILIGQLDGIIYSKEPLCFWLPLTSRNGEHRFYYRN